MNTTPQQILQEAREEKIDSKAKFIKEYMNDHNGGTPRWLRGAFYDEQEKIEAILDCMDKIYTSTLQSFIEAEIARLEGMKKSEDKYSKRNNPQILWTDIGFNQSIDDQISHLKKLLVIKR